MILKILTIACVPFFLGFPIYSWLVRFYKIEVGQPHRETVALKSACTLFVNIGENRRNMPTMSQYKIVYSFILINSDKRQILSIYFSNVITLFTYGVRKSVFRPLMGKVCSLSFASKDCKYASCGCNEEIYIVNL